MIDESLYNQLILDGSRSYLMPTFSRLENGDFVFVGDSMVSTEEELESIFDSLYQISQKIVEKYSEELESLFLLNINRYIALSNVYLLKASVLDFARFEDGYSPCDLESLNLDDIRRTIELIVSGVYEIHRIRLSLDGLSFDISDEDYFNENYAMIPLFTDKGLILRRNGDVLETVFHSVPVSLLKSLVEQVKNVEATPVQHQQLDAQMNKLRKDSMALALKFIYHTEDLKEAMEKLTYNWKMLVGVDLTSLE